MSNSCLKHNRADQCLAGLQDHGVIRPRLGVSTLAVYLRWFGSYSICVWGVLTFWTFMGEVAAEGTFLSSPHSGKVVRIGDARDISSPLNSNRRDPFKRIPQHLPISKVTKPSHPHPDSKIVPLVNDPDWRLLGVMLGQNGYQAVIQVSSTERVLAEPGIEIGRSGWIIKTISHEDVWLEHLPVNASARGTSSARTFILSFPTIQ